jgi:hypothetical protein
VSNDTSVFDYRLRGGVQRSVIVDYTLPLSF